MEMEKAQEESGKLSKNAKELCRQIEEIMERWEEVSACGNSMFESNTYLFYNGVNYCLCAGKREIKSVTEKRSIDRDKYFWNVLESHKLIEFAALLPKMISEVTEKMERRNVEIADSLAKVRNVFNTPRSNRSVWNFS